ncbi:MAG: hypothetical protein ORN83_13525, partial [Chthoniobacteraceae bacterium]|nr:hypothetical protein [Chthoniobacteraceae bacterium]
HYQVVLTRENRLDEMEVLVEAAADAASAEARAAAGGTLDNAVKITVFLTDLGHFGRVNEMHIYLDEDEDSGYYVEEILPGSTIGQVLTLTQWDVKELARQMKAQTDAAIKSDRLKPNEAMRLLDDYEKSLTLYTYLNFDDQHNAQK